MKSEVLLQSVTGKPWLKLTSQYSIFPSSFTSIDQSHNTKNWVIKAELQTFNRCYYCRKTAVCVGDQLLDFSVPELVRSQSTFSNDLEVLQNCTGFTLCSSAGLAVGKCPAVMDLTPCILCVQIYCVVCVGLLSADFSTVNTGLGRPRFWKPLCLLSTPEGLAATNYQLT